MKIFEEKDGWYLDTYPYALVSENDTPIYKFGPHTKEKIYKLLESAQHIINGDFS